MEHQTKLYIDNSSKFPVMQRISHHTTTNELFACSRKMSNSWNAWSPENPIALKPNLHFPMNMHCLLLCYNDLWTGQIRYRAVRAIYIYMESE